MKVVITHAYSTSNRGDGLLVDLAIAAIVRSLGPDVEIGVLAIDAASFDGNFKVFQYPPAHGGVGQRVSATLKLVAATASGNGLLEALGLGDFGRPDLFVGVGGGYMRLDGGVSSLKAFVAHGLQMRATLATGIPTYYLSQSVGPLHGPLGKLMCSWVAKLGRINVRDDRSVKLLEDMGASNVVRRPDMAIFSIAQQLDATQKTASRAGPPRLIARELKRQSEVKTAYEQKLNQLITSIQDLAPALQSSGRGNDDPAFYAAMGWNANSPFLRDLIAQGELPRAIVSVRLHGALEAIRAGVPTVHLSYERKGFGAFADLGIGEYVHNVNDFDLELVVRQMNELIADPTEYWRRVHDNMNAISENYELLMKELHSVAVGSRA